MQAVILAAGKGVRMAALTKRTPKALLEIAGKSLLERKLEILPDAVEQVIIVVGYLGGMIQSKFGGVYGGKRLIYVEQKDLSTGTAGALWYAKDIIKDRFLVMMADDIYSKEDVKKCIAEKDWALLVKKAHSIGDKGEVETDAERNIMKVTEGYRRERGGLMSTNMFLLDTRIFNTEPVPKAPGSAELGLPQTAIAAARAQNIAFKAIEAKFWIPISTPEDLKEAENALTKT